MSIARTGMAVEEPYDVGVTPEGISAIVIVFPEATILVTVFVLEVTFKVCEARATVPVPAVPAILNVVDIEAVDNAVTRPYESVVIIGIAVEEPVAENAVTFAREAKLEPLNCNTCPVVYELLFVPPEAIPTGLTVDIRPPELIVTVPLIVPPVLAK